MWRHIGRVFGIRIGAVGLTALTYLMAARLMGTYEFGRMATAVSVITVIQTLADLGTSSFIARAAATNDHRPAVSLGLALRFVYVVVAAMVVGGSAVLQRDGNGLVVWASILALSSLSQTMLSAVLLGLGNSVRSTLPMVIDRATGACLLLLLAGFGRLNAPDVLACLAVGSTMGMVVALVWCRGHLAPPRFPAGTRTMLRESTSFMATGLGAQLQNLDVPIVGALAGSYQAGILAAPSRLTTPLGVLAGSAASILLVARRHRPEAQERHGDTAQVTLAVSTLTAVVLVPLLVAPGRVSTALLGAEYSSGATTFQAVALAVIVASINQTFAATMQSRGQHRSVSRAVLLGGATGICCVAALAPALGAFAGGLGVLISQVLILTLLLKYRRARSS